MSHELRTPLTAIKGYLETVLDESMLESAMHRRFLEIANSHAERMGRLINDLLNLSDIETGKVVLHPTAISLGPFVQEISAIFEKDAEKKEVRLLNQIPHDLWVEADRDRLSQILVNLVDNAVKYSRKGERSGFMRRKPRPIKSVLRSKTRDKVFPQAICLASRNDFTGSTKRVPVLKAAPALVSPL